MNMMLRKIFLRNKKTNSLNTGFFGTENCGSQGNLGRFHAFSFVHG